MLQVAVILTDAKRRILWVNQDFEAITGYRYEEVIGQSPGAILQGPATESDAIARIRENIAKGTSFKDTITNYRKNGESYICRLVIHPVYDQMQRLVNFLAFEVDGNLVKEENDPPLLSIDSRYQTSSLRGVKEVQLFNHIQEKFVREQIYIDPDLSLNSLAELVRTNTKYLSQVINHFTGQRFMTYVNTFRVEAVKRRLAEGEHCSLTLMGVAELCGFINKSTFYKVFKEMTGVTPKAYAQMIFKEQLL